MDWIDVDRQVAQLGNERAAGMDRDALPIELAAAAGTCEQREVVMDVQRLPVVHRSGAEQPSRRVRAFTLKRGQHRQQPGSGSNPRDEQPLAAVVRARNMDRSEHEQRVALQPFSRSAPTPMSDAVIGDVLADAERRADVLEEIECPIKSVRLRRDCVPPAWVAERDPAHRRSEKAGPEHSK